MVWGFFRVALGFLEGLLDSPAKAKGDRLFVGDFLFSGVGGGG